MNEPKPNSNNYLLFFLVYKNVIANLPNLELQAETVFLNAMFLHDGDDHGSPLIHFLVMTS